MSNPDLGQVFTSEAVADFMVNLFTLPKNSKIIEPCFGDGEFLKALVKAGFTDIEGYEIDSNLFSSVKRKFPDLKLSQCDFLKIDETKKSDGIIMNPPYIRQEKIDDLIDYGITKQILHENNVFEDLELTSNMYMYFILKAIQLLRPLGELVVIFPSSWKTARIGKKFKEQIKSKCVAVEEISISGEVFKKDALVEVEIIKFIKGDISSIIRKQSLIIENNNIYKKDIKGENFNLGKNFNATFEEYASIRRGLTTGYNSFFINPDIENSPYFLKSIISSPKDIIGYSTENSKTDNILFIDSQINSIPDEVRLYLDKWQDIIFETKKPKTLFEKIENNKKWYALSNVDSKGIIFSYFVRNDMKFVLNNRNIIVRDNFYIIKPKIDKSIMFAFLNNYYTYFQLETFGKKYGAGLLKLQRYDLEKLIFPSIKNFSENELLQMANLSKELSEEGKAENIELITKIISLNSSESFELISERYKAIKANRLE